MDEETNNNNQNQNSSNEPPSMMMMPNNLEEFDRMIEENAFQDDQLLPKSLIITNMDYRIFNNNSQLRSEFEETFRQMDNEVKFLYFKSFKRARVDFSTSQLAIKARILMNKLKFGDEFINCYFAEVNESPSSNDLLKPPALEKQFLISPPASPPEGWEPVEEAQPVLNIDLQSALANLLPGSTHQLHPPSLDQPGIVVHICSTGTDKPNSNNDNDNDEDNGEMSFNIKNRTMKIAQTPCPPSMQKLRQQQ